MRRVIFYVVLAAVLFAPIILAQDKADNQATAPFRITAPSLSTEQKQAVQILAQKIEIAQLRAQAAQADFEKARAEIATLVQSLQKEGFDLDLQTLSYTQKKVDVKK